MRRGQRWWLDGALLLVSVAVAWILIEGVLFPLLVPRLPLRLHAYLGDLELLSQSSKAGLTPRNYVALLGDSYAQGVGDWLLQADPDAPASYGSAHVIHDLSGRDVLTFGRAGAGSFESMVSEPFRRFGEVAGSPWYRLDPPSDAIVYFYEGNDLDDNLRTLRRRGLAAGDGTVRQAAVAALVEGEGRAIIARSRGLWSPALQFAAAAAADRLGWHERPTAPPSPPARAAAPPPTLARIDGRPVALPDRLQGPSLQLTPTETESGVVLFAASLDRLRAYFPGARLLVVYIPSPLGSYRLISPTASVQVYEAGRPDVVPADRVDARRQDICAMIRRAALDAGAGFADAGPALRTAAERRPIHGPRDWKHLNQDGQTVLGLVVADALAGRPGPRGTCR